MDPLPLLGLASAATIGAILTSAVALSAWRDWLAVKRLALSRPRGGASLAELKARVRRLEAIAGGGAL